MSEFLVLDDGRLTERSAHEAAVRVSGEDQSDVLTNEVHNMMMKAYTTFTAIVRRNNPTKLSLGRYNVLRLLYHSEGSRLLMSDVGDGLEVSASIVTRLVDSLVEEGYVRRVDHPDDKRKTWAELTTEGHALFEAQMPMMRQQVRELWRGMDDDEKRLLIHLFAKLRLNLITRGFTDESIRRFGDVQVPRTEL